MRTAAGTEASEEEAASYGRVGIPRFLSAVWQLRVASLVSRRAAMLRSKEMTAVQLIERNDAARAIVTGLECSASSSSVT